MEKEIGRRARIYLTVAIISAILLGAFCYNFGVQIQPILPPSTYGFQLAILPQQYGRRFFTTDSNELRVLSANATQYELPVNLSMVVNIDDVTLAFHLDIDSLPLLRENGFVVVSGPEALGFHANEFDEIYNRIDNPLGIPIFISADSILHVYHIFFDQILQKIETKYLSQNMTYALKRLVEESINLNNSIPNDHEMLKEAANRNICFFSVATKLIDPAFEVPAFVNDTVTAELDFIEAHDGWHQSPLFGYKEDYSQYLPRGHYTKSDLLKRYFKAMMWLGRMRFMVKTVDLDPELAKMQTIQAVLITLTLNSIPDAKAIWEKLYSVTAFFVGFPDDLTIYDYEKAINKVYGEDPIDLENPTKLAQLQDKLMEMNDANIISTFIFPWQKAELVGLRFMGSRYIPDAYMFQELVYDKVAYRMMPKSLDIMTVLGSERAKEHLNDEITAMPDYAQQLNKLKEEFSELTVVNWTQNLYWSWLYSIKSTIQKFPEGYPTFMNTTAWLDEKLNTALGSWTELRHDTILYAKQSYAVACIPPTPPPGFVEPLPQLYNRLIGLCNMTINGLSALNLLEDIYEEKLLQFRDLLNTFIEISIKELKGEALSEEQVQFIKTIGFELGDILKAFTKDSQKSTLVADVHTDTWTDTVLEEGCGYIDIIIAVYKTSDGRLVAAAGPVFSYYEFIVPLNERLTDEEWIDVLDGNAPPRPTWTSSFHSSS